MEPSEKGTLVYPSLQGSTNWASPSYSPPTDLLYVPVREMGSVYYKTGVEYKPGTYYTGGSEKRLDEESWGAVRALDVKTGKQAWDFKLPSPTWAGVLATAGGLVFSGSNEGNFYALDAKTGKPLWHFQTGGAIRSGPMSFLAATSSTLPSPAVTRCSCSASTHRRSAAAARPASPRGTRRTRDRPASSKIGMPHVASSSPPLFWMARSVCRIVPDRESTRRCRRRSARRRSTRVARMISNPPRILNDRSAMSPARPDRAATTAIKRPRRYRSTRSATTCGA